MVGSETTGYPTKTTKREKKREKTKERQVQQRLHNGIRRRAGDRKIRGLSCVCELQLFGEVYWVLATLQLAASFVLYHEIATCICEIIHNTNVANVCKFYVLSLLNAWRIDKLTMRDIHFPHPIPILSTATFAAWKEGDGSNRQCQHHFYLEVFLLNSRHVTRSRAVGVLLCEFFFSSENGFTHFRSCQG
jgi:hypothetical protein